MSSPVPELIKVTEWTNSVIRDGYAIVAVLGVKPDRTQEGHFETVVVSPDVLSRSELGGLLIGAGRQLQAGFATVEDIPPHSE